MKNNKLINRLLLLFVILFLITIYFKPLLEDKYFPYWDTYENKFNSEALTTNVSPENISDPIFYYNLKIFNQITNLNYFIIIKYGPIIISIITLLFILFFYNRIIKGNKDIGILTYSILLFFLVLPVYQRYNLFVRENFVIFIGFLGLYYLLIKPEGELKISNNFIIGVILITYTFLSNFLVFLVIFTIIITFLSITDIKKIYSKEMLFLIFIILIISSPLITIFIKNVYTQIYFGESLITEKGSTVERNFIRLDYLDFNLYLPFILLGIILFLSKFKNDIPNKFILSFFISSIILFCIPYLNQIGVKQNRFAIYFAFLFIFFIFNYLIYLKRKNKFILLISILVLIILLLNFIIGYSFYRPINESNLGSLEKDSQNLKDLNYCGRSAWDAINFFNLNIDCKRLMFKEDLTDKKILMFKEDYSDFEFKNQIKDYSYEIYYEDSVSSSRIYSINYKLTKNEP